MDYRIKEREWEAIFKLLQKREDIDSSNETKVRIFIEAAYYVMRSGCQWRMLHSSYGKWRSVHKRFKRWSDKGIWAYLFEELKQEADMESSMIDTKIVRAHACSAGYKKDNAQEQALGRSKGGFSTKIHALVDVLDNPLKFLLTPGERNDITKAEELIKDCNNTAVIADKGYDANVLIDAIKMQNSHAIIQHNSLRY